MSKTDPGPSPRSARPTRLIEDTRHDPYRATQKLADPTGCPECGACFREGRWSWRAAPFDAPKALCPACQRVRDGYPAGFLDVAGEFLGAHADEIRGSCTTSRSANAPSIRSSA